MRVLLVEDEAPLRETLAARLKRDGFAVDAAGDGEEGLFLGREVPFDVAIIDLGLPKMSGMELVKQLREDGQRYPILILTARSSWQDKVQGLKYGADDYLVKPFHVEELLARLNALVRRASGWSRPLLECGPIALDTTAQTVSSNGNPVDLTSYEYKVLEYLMMHAGELVSKADLTEHIYQQDFDRDSNVLEVFIGRLRRKLDPENSIKPIETVRGRGYRFALERTDSGADEAASEPADLSRPRRWHARCRCRPARLRRRASLSRHFCGLAFFALDQAFFDAALSSQRDRLQGYMHAYLAGADTNRAGNLIPPEVGPDPRFDRPGSGLYASITGDHVRNAKDRQWRSPSALGLELPFETELSQGATEFRGPVHTAQGNLFILSQGITWSVPNRPELNLTLHIAEDSAALQTQVRVFRRTLLAWLGGLGVLLLAAAAGCPALEHGAAAQGRRRPRPR